MGETVTNEQKIAVLRRYVGDLATFSFNSVVTLRDMAGSFSPAAADNADAVKDILTKIEMVKKHHHHADMLLDTLRDNLTIKKEAEVSHV